MAWLLDTNVLSELRRPKPQRSVVEFVAAQPLDQLFISVVTLAEIRFGIQTTVDAERRAALDTWLDRTVRPMFGPRVLPVTEEVLFQWRLILENGRKSGHTFSEPDSLIAATAMCHEMTVVTRDRADFDRARVPVLDPWH